MFNIIVSVGIWFSMLGFEYTISLIIRVTDNSRYW